MIKRGIIFTIVLSFVAVACERVPITGRRQVSIVPESEMISMSLTSYSDFLSKNPPVSDADANARLVKKVG
ncbi:MAG: M48 family peptidase, partial [Bacteroidia bacterium]